MLWLLFVYLDGMLERRAALFVCIVVLLIFIFHSKASLNRGILSYGITNNESSIAVIALLSRAVYIIVYCVQCVCYYMYGYW